MKRTRRWVTASAAILIAGGVSAALAQPLGEGWLLGAPDDAARFRLLQSDAGGSGRTMFEMSVRYERIYDAIAYGNLEVAAHYWSSIRGSLRSGIVRRPDRAETANAFILDTLYERVNVELESGDIVRARAVFMEIRGACMGCHVANDLSYLNDQPLFINTVFN